MTRGILIAGNESSLFNAVSAEALRRVKSLASVLVPNRFSQAAPPLTPSATAAETAAPAAVSAEGAIPLSWNPASSISARTLVLAAENRIGKINDAIIVCSPPAVYRTIETLTPEEIDFIVNTQIKGWFFLVRELALYFRSQGSGSLSLISPEISASSSGGKNAPVDLLGPAAAASFKNFAQGILTSTENESFQLMGFSNSDADNDNDFAEWVFKYIDEGNKKNSGRWFKYSKLKFFR